MYLLVPFILQNFKKNLTADPDLWRCAIFEPKMTHLSWTKLFLVQTITITFIYLLALFTVQNLKKFLQQWGCAIFGPKMVHCPPPPPQNFFLVQTIIITFTHLLALFNVQNFKKSYSGSRVMIHHFWAQNGPSPPQVFFGKLLISFSSTY